MFEYDTGKQVICIREDFGDAVPPPVLPVRYPVKGQVYTIRDVRPMPNYLLLVFEEILNPEEPDWGELGFNASRFRPVRKTDISCFKRILVCEDHMA
jgi:hypothetical protein